MTGLWLVISLVSFSDSLATCSTRFHILTNCNVYQSKQPLTVYILEIIASMIFRNNFRTSETKYNVVKNLQQHGRFGLRTHAWSYRTRMSGIS